MSLLFVSSPLNILLNVFVLTLFFSQSLQIVPSVPYKYPTIYFDQNSTIATPKLSRYNIMDFQTTNNFIARLSVYGDLRIWSIENGALLYELFKGTSIKTNQSCLCFAFSSDETILVAATKAINESKYIHLFDLTSNGSIILSNETSLENIKRIQIIRQQIVILWRSESNISYFSRYKINGGNLTTLTRSIALTPTVPVKRMKVLQPSSISTFYYVITWVDQCAFQIFNCTVGKPACPQYEFYEAGNSTVCYSSQSNSSIAQQYKIQLSLDGTKLLFHEYAYGLRVYDLSSKLFDLQYQYTTAYNITETTFADSLNLYIGFTSLDGWYRVMQYNPGTSDILYSYQMFVTSIQFSEYNFQHKRFIVANNSMILMFPLTCDDNTMTLVDEGYCIQCPVNCRQCTFQGICTLCDVNFRTTVNNTCEYFQPVLPTNTTLNSSSTWLPISPNATIHPSIDVNITNSSSSNTINSRNNTPDSNSSSISNPFFPSNIQNLTENLYPSNKTINQQNQTESNSASNETKLNVTVQPIYDYEEVIEKHIHESLFDKVINVAFSSIMLLKVLPFSFFFIKFINFWSICSFYLLLDVPLPQHLSDILNMIYQKINDSVFDKIGLTSKFNLNPNEKITGFLSESYNLSSDFIDTNFENLCILSISLVILALFYVLKTFLPSSNILARMFSKINYEMAFLGQFIAIMGSFFTNMWVIKEKSYQRTFYEKLNMSLEFIFITFSLAIIAWVFLIIQKQPDNQMSEKEKSIQSKTWLAAWACNSLVPSFAVFGRIQLFYFFNLVLFGFEIHTAFGQLKFKINSIILSLQLVGFHIGFTILLFFDADNFPAIYHHAGLCMVILLFLGAVHELLTFFCGIFYNLYFAICHQGNSVSVQPLEFIESGKQKASNLTIQPEKQKLYLKSIHFSEKGKSHIRQMSISQLSQTSILQGLRIKEVRSDIEINKPADFLIIAAQSSKKVLHMRKKTKLKQRILSIHLNREQKQGVENNN